MVSDTVGAWPPPPGVTPNFINPESVGYRIIVVAVVLPAIAIPISLLRLYTKRYILRVVHMDDYLIGLANIFALGLSVLTSYQTANGLGAHIWDVPMYKFARFLKVGGILGPIFYNIANLCSKFSLAVFYLRLSPSRNFNGIVYATMFVTAVYCILAAFAFSFLCRPIQKYWDFSAPGSCININAFGISTGALNAATDILLLLLPIGIVGSLPSLSVRKRIAVALMLMAGSFVCIVSVIRLQVLIAWIKVPEIDGTRSMVTTFIWLLLETWGGIICANLPNLRAFIRRHLSGIYERAVETKFPAVADPQSNRGVWSGVDGNYTELGYDFGNMPGDPLSTMDGARMNKPIQATAESELSSVHSRSPEKSPRSTKCSSK